MDEQITNPNLTKCRHCGAVIAKEAKICPHCGGKNKKSRGCLVALIIILIVVIAAVALLVLYSIGTRQDSELYSSSSDSLTMDEEDYKSLCKEITYDELARNGNNLIGEKVRIKGQIIQVSYDEGIGSSEYRVATKEDEFGLWFDDVVYLFYDHSDNAKLLEDDIITIYGEISGDYTYESVGGGSITIPSIAGVYVDLQN